MTYENLIKNKIQHAFSSLLATLSIERKPTDGQMECMQFGILITLQNKLRRFPFFIINLSLF